MANPDPQPVESQLYQPDVDSELVDDGLTLEELSRTYARVLGQEVAPVASPAATQESTLVEVDAVSQTVDGPVYDPLVEELAQTDSAPVTPTAILEAILFVGRGDNQPISSAEMAGLMRGVSPAEIDAYVAHLNQHYRDTDSALQIVFSGGGYRMQLADDLSDVRDRFYGPQREAKLNQAAIDCLALVAYQPGIERGQLEEQRGQPSGAVLSQLVRRQLIEVKREGQKPRQLHYYPTPKLTQLIGLESLDDLPQVEEWQ